MWQVWLIIAGLCFIIEMATVGFFVFWFGVGAIISMIVSIFIDNIIIQASIFIISSVLLLFLTKPLAKKISKKEKPLETNAFSIIGKKGLVTQDINPTVGVGQVNIAGETWSAKTDDGSIIEKGSNIKVVKIDGVKAVVETTK